VLNADAKQDIRYDILSSELGAQLPTGAGVRVGQIEGPQTGGNYLPSLNPPTYAEFLGKNFVIQSGTTGVSTHARGVGQWFYGSSTSIAPGIAQVEAFEINSYLGDFLKVGTMAKPLAPTARVYNHSWVGEADNNTTNLDALRRIDYVVEKYDTLQVVGINNGSGSINYPLLSQAMNVIAVGRTDGNHASVTTNLSDPAGKYVAGRTTPQIVAPRTTTSQATALVSGAAAMLIEAASTNTQWSNGSYNVPNGQTVQHAATAEVIKAALMAGARREDVSNYVVNTLNGLNQKFGAGELDIYNSYHILAGGEQDGGSPLSAPVTIGAFGFDYAPSFANNQESWYQFTSASELSVSLAWNIAIAGGGLTFDGTATLPNFDLYLYRIDAGSPTLIASSTSTIDNTENLWLTNLDPQATYRIAVNRNDALGSFDYGLAWRMTVVPEPSSLALGIVAAAALALMMTVKLTCPL
jgi:hypothetical protein